MDPFGKATSLFLLAGSIALPFLGCSQKSGGQFETYDHLKKSATAAAAAPVLAETPARSKVAATIEKPAPTSVAKFEPAAPQSPAIASANAAPSGIKVTDAVFQASVAATSPKSGAVPVSATTTARKTQLLVADRKFKPEGPDGAWRVSYDDIDLLKVLNMDPVPADAAAKMPAWLKGLEGKRIRIRGFMYPTFSQTGIHAFGLARDNQICCFGRNPKIYDIFDVRLRDGVTTDYLPNRPFDVVGVFHIRPEAEEGKLFHLYDMDDATVVNK
jgi:hypothetical protein